MTTAVSPPEPVLDPEPPKTEDPAPLRAVHTPNFPSLLRQLGASLLVTTYQAGKLVLIRDEGNHINPHFRGFQAPMGMADVPAALRGPTAPTRPAARAGSAGNGSVPRGAGATA
jgi:hypothetical protein